VAGAGQPAFCKKRRSLVLDSLLFVKKNHFALNQASFCKKTGQFGAGQPAFCKKKNHFALNQASFL
jgi:hypothetical protein